MGRNELERLEIRVQRSVDRLGFTGLQVKDLGGGHVEINAASVCRDDRNTIIAAVRTVIGVESVSFSA